MQLRWREETPNQNWRFSFYWLKLFTSCSIKNSKKSYVAAGSVVTTDVPSGSLAFVEQSKKQNQLKKIMCV